MKAKLFDIPVNHLQRGRFQPRVEFNEQELAELALSIQSAGVIQPLVVRPIGAERYEIVAGERRWRASQLAGLSTVPCLVKHYTDEQTAAVTTIENINRVDLNPIEEARAYQRLIDEFQYLHDEVAAVVGKSRTKITNALRLLKLVPEVQTLLIHGELSEGHGKILAGLESKQQHALALKIVKYQWSVRRAEKEAKQILTGKKQVNIDPDIKSLEKRLGDYIGCDVNIDHGDDRCRMHIDCHNIDVLQGVLEKLGFKHKEKG